MSCLSSRWAANNRNINTITEWLIDNRNVLLTVLEARSPRSGCQHNQVLVKVLFQVANQLLLPVVSSHGREQKQEASSLVTPKGTNPTDEGSTHMITPTPNYLPMAPPPKTITYWGRGRFQHANWEKTQTLVHNTCRRFVSQRLPCDSNVWPRLMSTYLDAKPWHHCFQQAPLVILMQLF